MLAAHQLLLALSRGKTKARGSREASTIPSLNVLFLLQEHDAGVAGIPLRSYQQFRYIKQFPRIVFNLSLA